MGAGAHVNRWRAKALAVHDVFFPDGAPDFVMERALPGSMRGLWERAPSFASRLFALAELLRERGNEIVTEWEQAVKRQPLSGNEPPCLRDAAPRIVGRVAAIVEALAGGTALPGSDPEEPACLHTDVAKLWVEYALLRRCIVRRCIVDGRDIGIDALSIVDDVIEDAALTAFTRLAKLREEHAQQRRARSEAHNAAILEAALDSIVSMDADGTVIGWNAAAERTFGFASEDAVGRDLADLIIPPDLREAHRRGLARYLATGREQYLNRRLEMRAIRNDGTELPVELVITRIAVSGPPVFTGHIRDVTERRRAEQALRESQELLQSICDHSPSVIFAKDGDGKYLFINREYARLFDVAQLEVVGKTDDVLHPSAVARAAREADRKVLESGEPLTLEQTIPTVVGDRVFVSVKFPLLDAEGRPHAVCGIATDITERKRVEEAFRMLANSIPQLAWMADETGYIFWYNQRWYDYTGTTLEEMQGWGWQKVHHPDEVERVVARLRHAFETGEIWEDTFPLRSRDGEYRRFLSRALPIRDERGKVVRWFGTNTDIEERLRVEEELQRRIAFEEQLIGIVSHDLRNPIGAIQLGAELLLDGNSLDERATKTLGRVLRSAERASRMVNDLLDFTRERTGKAMPIEPRAADLHELSRAIVEEVRLAHPGRVIEELHEGDARGEWDTDRLAQVLTNLTSNALAYSDGKCPVRVSTRGAADSVILQVHNCGAPIAPGVIARLFQPFERGAPSDAGARSVGLGLFIVDRIVHAHGGRVDVRSTAEEGTTFSVHLPRRAGR